MKKQEENNTTNTSYLPWIDWMKVIAMYFIIAGHCFVPFNKYIYVFSVPCFFVISGFLSHKESDNKLFWKKIFWNMLVPMALLLVINVIFNAILQIRAGIFSPSYLWKRPLLAFAGMQGQNFQSGGLGVLWFVYTLCLCKIVLQFVPKRYEIFINILFIVFCLLSAVYINSNDIEVYSSYVDVLLSYPFFVAGYYLRTCKLKLNNIGGWKLSLMFFLSSIIVIICGRYNDIVMLYKCSYGSDLLLCLIGGFAGTISVYAISKTVSQRCKRVNISVLGGGTIIILGLHQILIIVVGYLCKLEGFILYGFSLAVLLTFIPINSFIRRYIPILYGKIR